MKNILLCTDGSLNARNAIQYALNFFSGEPKHFILLSTYIINNTEPGKIISVNDELKLNTQLLIDKELNWCKNLDEFKGFTITAMSSFGKTSNVVFRIIQEKNIELMVAGTKGENVQNNSIIGSTTCELIDKIPGNKMIVPPENKFSGSYKRTIITDSKKLGALGWETIGSLAELKRSNISLIILPTLSDKEKKSFSFSKEIENEIINTHYFPSNLSPEEYSQKLSSILQEESPDMVHINVGDNNQKDTILSNSFTTRYPFILHS